ncbi:hypothetical protein BKA93DRAFT_830458 [Sparassis latifolia]|uniref:snRNA-activating protein complex subunit 4 n=1 Tax=Sparassis crispa TaxID=139825 RepID=A0A401GB89_9APHY|nr:snRNA-activating protein complex subunit 4 [Sparassis crispa]GBE79411.1 snRNA-activating protein complex subunit 4 [Sparassis crispa]
MATNPPDIKGLAQRAVQVNKEHQYALKVYTERVEAELQTIDKLLAVAELSEHEDELEVNAGGDVVIPNSVKATGMVLLSDLLAEDSPYHRDATRRQNYVDSTVLHPMKGPELEALADAVRSENYRIHAYEAQQRGQQPFIQLDDYPAGHFEQNKVGINWERVAKKVSSSGATVQRSAKECEIRWLGERHPLLNHVQWTQTEITRVKELVADATEGQVDWVDVAAKLGTRRTPVDCMRHAIIRKTHTWSTEADERLLEAVKIYGTDSWSLVARMVSEDATASQCQNRYVRTVDPNIKRGAWTEEEDAQLRRAVAVFDHSWVDVATCIAGRNNEQCRDRYQEYLNPTVTRGKWTEAQDQALLQAYETVGEAKWKEISKLVGNGRTDNMCRSRYTVLMKRQAKTSTASPAAAGPSSSSRSSFVPLDFAPPQVQPTQPTEPVQLARPQPKPRPPCASTSAVPADETGDAVAPAALKPRPKPKARRKTTTDTANSSQVLSSAVCDATEGGTSTGGIRPDQAAATAHRKGKGKEKAHDDVIQLKPPPARAAKRKAPAGADASAAERPPPKRRKTKTTSAQTVEGIANSDGVPQEAAGEVEDEQEAQAGPSAQPEFRAGPDTKAKGKIATRKVHKHSRKKGCTVDTLEAAPLDAQEVGASVDVSATSGLPDDLLEGSSRPSTGRRGRKGGQLTNTEPTRRQPARAAARRALASPKPVISEPQICLTATTGTSPVETSEQVEASVVPCEVASGSELSSIPSTPGR